MSSLTMDMSFGSQLKKIRISNGISLRERAKQLKLDAGNYSKLENGILSPPQFPSGILKLVKGLKVSDRQIELLNIAACGYHVQWLEYRIEELKCRFGLASTPQEKGGEW